MEKERQSERRQSFQGTRGYLQEQNFAANSHLDKEHTERMAMYDHEVWAQAGVQSRRCQVPFLLPEPFGIPSTSPEVSFPSQSLGGALKLPSHDPHSFKPSTIQWITLSVAKGTKGFLSKLSPCQPKDEFGIW